MIEIEHPNEDPIITVRASGKLSARDYNAAIPEIEHARKRRRGPLRLLIRLEDFRGWEMEALWQELKFDYRYQALPGRIAVVGESALEKWGTRLSAPFAKAEMRYYPVENADEARKWLLQP